MKKGFFVGFGAAGLFIGLFSANNEYWANETVSSITNFIFSVPGYIFAVWLNFPDLASLLTVFLYFGIVGLIMEFFCERKKGKIFFIIGFSALIIFLHWFFNMKLSEEMAAISKALQGLNQLSSGQVVK